MIQLRSVRSADLAGAELEALRRLVLDAFNEHFTEHDWNHTIGGWHILAHEGDEVVAHAGVVTRTLVAGSPPSDTPVRLAARLRALGTGGAGMRAAGLAEQLAEMQPC